MISVHSHFIPLIGDRVEITRGSESIIGSLVEICGNHRWKITTERRGLIQVDQTDFPKHARDGGNFLLNNAYDPVWKKVVSIDLHVQKAPTGRTSCVMCKSKIEKGLPRVSHVRKWMMSNKKGVQERTSWYHANCVPKTRRCLKES